MQFRNNFLFGSTKSSYSRFPHCYFFNIYISNSAKLEEKILRKKNLNFLKRNYEWRTYSLVSKSYFNSFIFCISVVCRCRSCAAVISSPFFSCSKSSNSSTVIFSELPVICSTCKRSVELASSVSNCKHAFYRWYFLKLKRSYCLKILQTLFMY